MAPSWRSRLTALGRLGLYVVLQYMALVSLMPLWRQFGLVLGAHGAAPLVQLLLYEVGMLLVLLVAIGVMCRFVERRPLGSVGLAWRSDSMRQMLLGTGLGGGMLSAVVLLGTLTGVYVVRLGWESGFLMPWLLYAIDMFLVALVEELTFRGYLLQVLQQSVGSGGAILLTALLFGAVHLGNPAGGLGSVLGLSVFGLLAGYIAVRTRNLWTVIGLHWAWNVFEGAVFGLPNSGMRYGGSIFRTLTHGPAWWTGGGFGPEAGLLSTLAFAGGWLWYLCWRRTMRGA